MLLQAPRQPAQDRLHVLVLAGSERELLTGLAKKRGEAVELCRIAALFVRHRAGGRRRQAATRPISPPLRAAPCAFGAAFHVVQ
jgi:hypothetical protein